MACYQFDASDAEDSCGGACAKSEGLGVVQDQAHGRPNGRESATESATSKACPESAPPPGVVGVCCILQRWKVHDGCQDDCQSFAEQPEGRAASDRPSTLPGAQYRTGVSRLVYSAQSSARPMATISVADGITAVVDPASNPVACRSLRVASPQPMATGSAPATPPP